MRDQGLRQAERVPVGDKPGVDLRRLDPPAPLGDPKRRVVREAEPGPDVLNVVATASTAQPITEATFRRRGGWPFFALP